MDTEVEVEAEEINAVEEDAEEAEPTVVEKVTEMHPLKPAPIELLGLGPQLSSRVIPNPDYPSFKAVELENNLSEFA